MFNPKYFRLYDAERSLMLTIGPLGRREALAGLPGELFLGNPLLAARLGIEPIPESVMNERQAEFASLDETSLLRIWFNPTGGPDGRDVLASPADALPETGTAPDWGLVSAGWFVTDPMTLADWAEERYETDDVLLALSTFLSKDIDEEGEAVRLVETATQRILNVWPVQHENPLRALRLATQSWPEVRYAEEDFRFVLDVREEPASPPAIGAGSRTVGIPH